MTKALRTSVRSGGLRQGGLQAGLGSDNIFATASLDLNFAVNKNLGTLVDATTGSNLVDFTRASSGTYVGSDGLIKTAVTNLLLQSEDFSTTWGNTLLTDNVDATAAPNGTITADEIIETTAANIRSKEQTITSVASAVYTLSVFAKSGNGDKRFLRLSLNSAASTSLWAAASYDLDDGTVAGSDSAGGGTVTSTSIQPFGNGWYRCILTGNIGANTDLRALVTLTPSSSTYTSNGRGRTAYTGDDVSSIYIWGAQLEQSSTVGAYVKTTSTINSAPRFNHDPTTGESLGLLVEESRTNLIIKSEELDDAAWTKGGSTISANAIAAPTGTTTADKIAEDNSNSSHRVISTAPSWAGSTAYTYSFYAKADERTLVYGLIGTTVVASRLLVIFDLSTGVVTTSSGSPTSTSMTNVGGGWYRCSITFTSIASPSGGVVAGIWSATEVYTGTAGSGIYLWGAQLEAGSFPTSYIPTTTATVTRAADVASTSGSNFSSWYRQDEGTFFAEVPQANFVAGRILQFSDGTTTNRQDLAFSNSKLLAFVNTGGSSQVNALTDNTITNSAKCSYGYKADDFAWVLNGESPKTDNTGTLPTVDRLTIGARIDSPGHLNGTIRRLTYWPTRLGNEVLQTITQ